MKTQKNSKWSPPEHLSPPSPKHTVASLKAFMLCPTSGLPLCMLSYLQERALGGKGCFKLRCIPPGSGSCWQLLKLHRTIQLSTDIGNSICPDVGDCTWHLFGPIRGTGFQADLTDSWQIPQSSVCFSLNSPDQEGSLHVHFRKISLKNMYENFSSVFFKSVGNHDIRTPNFNIPRK